MSIEGVAKAASVFPVSMTKEYPLTILKSGLYPYRLNLLFFQIKDLLKLEIILYIDKGSYLGVVISDYNSKYVKVKGYNPINPFSCRKFVGTFSK